MIRRSLFLLLSLSLMTPWATYASKPKPVKVELISDRAELLQGESFRLGVLFTMDPGWHIYGKQAGELGLPTVIELSLPPGLKLGELHWPETKEFTQAGNVSGTGYSASALIFGTIDGDVGAGDSKIVKIDAKVKWLSCSMTTCIPERRTLTLEIPVGAESRPVNQELFRNAGFLLR